MPIAKIPPPKTSLVKLRTALDQLIPLREGRRTWMHIRLSSVRGRHILYPHPVYHVHLLDLLEGHTFGKTLHRSGWMYFLRNPEGHLACVEISIVGGKHKNFQLIEGPFVANVFYAIERSRNDHRLRRSLFQLRSIRIESLHAFALWFKASGSTECWVPVTPIGATCTEGRWLSRREFVELLETEARRVADSHQRALQFANHNSKSLTGP
jgi:hypothetical protein